MAFVDSLGYTVDVGIVVGFEEKYITPDTEEMYVVVGFVGNMVELVEIDELELDGMTCDVTYLTVANDQIITVEPWKIGAI